MLKRIFRRLPISYYPYKPFMHTYNCIFIHIPKNAGSSVLRAFNDQGGRKHAKWHDFYAANSYFFRRYHKFAIVREPAERLYSAYRYYLKGGNQSEEDLALTQKISEHNSNFSGFVESILDTDFYMLQPLFQPQYLYVYDRRLICRVDRLLRYETLMQDWRDLARAQAFPENLPWVNASQDKVESNNKPSLPALSEKAIKKINQLYKLDFELLGYRPLSLPTDKQDS
ncbi:sulfotransferase family 2 domain-containing protein [Thalassomonas haliotis]|uniref:Sulfotransferase family 2 domain-containing protein n=1 Tax=Thalassomonas haliotis TaxID=485448 RepID=A0ABY7VHR9_9GAMM|nr:sulfotransferase family 2 domain-containing protein [Thalassomonas haliotis]WDE13277.1 sulfotransferase family 2 domain-containing protein [Thalassomonas haliotis]